MAESFFFTYAMVNIFCITIFVILMLNMNQDIANFMEIVMFKASIVAMIIDGICDTIWILGENGFLPSYSNMANFIVNCGQMTAIICSTYFWLLYVEAKVHPYVLAKRSFTIVCMLPLLAAAVLHVASYWTGWIFSITPENTYVRGPLFMVHMAIAYTYPITAFIHSFVKLKNDSNELSIRERMIINLFAMTPFIVGIFHVIIPGTPITLPAFTIAFLFMFIHLQSRQIYTDALTDLNNRRRADEYLKAKLAQTEENSFYLFILDVDKFKKINDTYGHLEGDKALVAVAEAMRRTCGGYGGFAARYGGDEFMMIANKSNVVSPENIMETLREHLAECKKTICPNLPQLHISIGYTLCEDKRTSAVDIISRADDMLYEEKRKTSNKTK